MLTIPLGIHVLLKLVDDVEVVMPVDAVVDVVQLEVRVLDRTQQVMLLFEGFCT